MVAKRSAPLLEGDAAFDWLSESVGGCSVTTPSLGTFEWNWEARRDHIHCHVIRRSPLRCGTHLK